MRYTSDNSEYVRDNGGCIAPLWDFTLANSPLKIPNNTLTKSPTLMLLLAAAFDRAFAKVMGLGLELVPLVLLVPPAEADAT